MKLLAMIFLCSPFTFGGGMDSGNSKEVLNMKQFLPDSVRYYDSREEIQFVEYKKNKDLQPLIEKMISPDQDSTIYYRNGKQLTLEWELPRWSKWQYKTKDSSQVLIRVKELKPTTFITSVDSIVSDKDQISIYTTLWKIDLTTGQIVQKLRYK